MTKRCKFCGVKMSDAEIDGKAVHQCPICGYVVPKSSAKQLETQFLKEAEEK